MIDDVLNEAKIRVSEGGMVVVGVAGDANAVMDLAKQAAKSWGSRAVAGEESATWYVRVKMGHVVFQPTLAGRDQDFQV